jgi:hypothetical protein
LGVFAVYTVIIYTVLILFAIEVNAMSVECSRSELFTAYISRFGNGLLAVAKRLRHYAINRKVVSSILDEVFFFKFT